jgi:hypothetical protein
MMLWAFSWNISAMTLTSEQENQIVESLVADLASNVEYLLVKGSSALKNTQRDLSSISNEPKKVTVSKN